MKHNRFAAILISLLCFFIAASLIGCTESKIENQPSETVSTVQRQPGTADFLPTSELAKLKNTEFDGGLFTRVGFAYITFDNYIIRYNKESNTIDKLVKLGEMKEDRVFRTTFSWNQQYALYYSYNSLKNEGMEDSVNFTLIDFKNETSELLTEKYDKTISEALKQTSPFNKLKDYDNFEFSTEVYKTDLLTQSTFSKYAQDKTVCASVSQGNILYLLTCNNAVDTVKLGDLKMTVVDLESDAMLSTCNIIK